MKINNVGQLKRFLKDLDDDFKIELNITLTKSEKKYQETFRILQSIMEYGKEYNAGTLKRKTGRELSPYLKHYVETGQLDRVGHGKYKLNAKA